MRPVPTDNNRQTKANNVALSYDGNGNLISEGSRTYVWDDRDRLIQIKSGSTVIASFSYDALGRRIAKTEGGATTNHLCDGLDVVQETQGTTVNPILTGAGHRPASCAQLSCLFLERLAGQHTSADRFLRHCNTTL
ncbi:hypothetical protein [Pseudoxanthomonas sp. UC19_8]|uniref:hypothetical protein n=1 Tax=Pseudoxanthomonas sp. UC19_8 TaxID=3350175 RepID=UPI0036D3B98A